jgi:hypothetical protein
LTKMITVYLTPDEIDSSLIFIGAMRKDKQEFNVTDRKFDAKNTSWAVNLMGHLGERAVAKVYGVSVDDRVLTGGDAGHDLIINGKTVQVKTTITRQLIFNSRQSFSAEYAILVTLVGDRTQPHIDSHFIVWGDISQEKFLNICFEKDFGYGVRYVCNLEDLGQELKAVPLAHKDLTEVE